jgi:hypothetical protein
MTAVRTYLPASPGAVAYDQETTMFDPKKLLDELLGSNIPGTEGTVRDKAGQAVDMARKNPLATGALAAVLPDLATGLGKITRLATRPSTRRRAANRF